MYYPDSHFNWIHYLSDGEEKVKYIFQLSKLVLLIIINDSSRINNITVPIFVTLWMICYHGNGGVVLPLVINQIQITFITLFIISFDSDSLIKKIKRVTCPPWHYLDIRELFINKTGNEAEFYGKLNSEQDHKFIRREL